ncbi:hypothetical protein [Candidatus Endomicrobiellum pyrsonymphae]
MKNKASHTFGIIQEVQITMLLYFHMLEQFLNEYDDDLNDIYKYNQQSFD